MNQILYFIPGRKSREQINEILPGRFDSSFSTRTVVHGPESEPAGEIIAASESSLELQLDQQHWQRSGCGSFWFGWWRDRVPTAVDLLRASTISGSLTRSGWMVPRVRKHHMENGQLVFSIELPRKALWDGTAFRSGDVVQQFRPIEELASTVHAMLEEMHRASWEDSDRMIRLPADAALRVAEILQINYRVGPDELAALEAFQMDFRSLNEVLEIFVSRDLFHQLVKEAAEQDDEKKNLPVSS